MQQRLPKFKRDPERIGPRRITPQALQILFIVARYRFLQSSFIVQLVSGNGRIIKDHLQHLFHRGLVNRFQLEKNGEFSYYVDDLAVARLLQSSGFVVSAQMEDWITSNREKDYAGAVIRQEHGQLLFIEHELMISRFHALVEIGCNLSGGEVELTKWVQGSPLSNYVEAPAMKFADQRWYELDRIERLPHVPDALFTLRFPKAAEGSQLANFFYEADRGTMTATDMRRKLRAHFFFIAKKRLHQQLYGTRRIRAVLIETLRTSRAQELCEVARHPIVSDHKPSPLFWFTTSELFGKLTDTTENGKVYKRPLYAIQPDVIFRKIWAPPTEDELFSLLD